MSQHTPGPWTDQVVTEVLAFIRGLVNDGDNAESADYGDLVSWAQANGDTARALLFKIEGPPEVNGYLSAVGMATAAPLHAALKWHLQSNHFPPVPAVMVPVAERAVLAARGGDWAKLLRLPAGVRYRGNVKASVAEVVESFHLDAFVETHEENPS